MSGKRRLTGRELSAEFVAGLFFFGALAVLLVFTVILSRETLFGRQEVIDVVFPGVAGLREGDQVLVRGVPLGTVKSMQLAGSKVRVRLVLRKNLTIYRGYRVEIRYSSVLGGRFVMLDVGHPQDGVARDQDLLQGEGPPDLISEAGAAMQTLRSEVTNLRERLEEEDVLANLGATLSDLSVITEKVRQGEGTLGKLVADASLYDELSAGVAEMRNTAKQVDSLAVDLRKTIAGIRQGRGTLGRLVTEDDLYENVDAVVRDLREGRGTVGKLLVNETAYDDLVETTAALRRLSRDLESGESSLGRFLSDRAELYDSVNRTATNLEELTATVKAGRGTLGKLIRDREMYDAMRKLVMQARNALEDFREQAPVSTFGGLIFGAL